MVVWICKDHLRKGHCRLNHKHIALSTTTMSQRVWLITGCSSGLGQAMTLEALKRGDKVIATARAPISRLADLEVAGAAVLELDVSWSADRIKAVFAEAVKIYGQIDVLVCNAGRLFFGVSEALT